MTTTILRRFRVAPTPRAGRYVFALLLAALVLVGCSDGRAGEQEAAASTAAEFDEADVAFARAMIPHGEQGADTSEIVLDVKGLDPDVRALATELVHKRQAETTQLEQWVAARGEPVAAEAPGHSHGGGEDGIATPAQMSGLRYAGGSAAQQLYVDMMTRHHRGAVAAAREQVAQGHSPQLAEFARMILQTREAQLPVLVDAAARAVPPAPTRAST